MLLKDYFLASDHPEKDSFDKLLDKISLRTDFFSYITHYKPGRFLCTSPSIELITSFSVKQFEDEGVNFFVSRIPHEDTLAILKAQSEYFIKALEPDFDQSAPFVLDMPCRLPKSDGSIIVLVGSGIPLSYIPSGAIDFTLMIAYPQRMDEAEEKKVNKEIHDLLTSVKILYHKIYVSPKIEQNKISTPVEIVTSKGANHFLTVKEKKILQMIAQGSSSKEIAISMGISENTVESHRKNMLQKFEAKNTAELVTKATKLYWLE